MCSIDSLHLVAGINFTSKAIFLQKTKRQNMYFNISFFSISLMNTEQIVFEKVKNSTPTQIYRAWG
jgi:hypothetical protein